MLMRHSLWAHMIVAEQGVVCHLIAMQFVVVVITQQLLVF